MTGLRPLVQHWRASLQTRVAVTTFVVSGAVIVILGVTLLHQVQHGILTAKVRSALAELTSGVQAEQAQLVASPRTDQASLDNAVYYTFRSLAQRGSPSGLFDVILLSADGAQPPRTSGDVTVASVPPSLIRTVTQSDREAYAYATLSYNSGPSVAGLVVGAQVVSSVGPPYQLYYLFPLRQEAATIGLVRRTMLFAGAVLTLLLVGVAALVTRQVVTPVRLAARTAERLAAGRLEERMAVHGTDDLARLAESYNHMAAALQGQIRKLEDLSRVQRQFVADVSHELRTPLTTVRMAADLLYETRGAFNQQASRSAELLQNQLDRFEALLADLLEISRHDAGAVVLEAEPVDLRTLVARAAESVEPLAARRGSELRLALGAEPVVADVDARRIDRVLRNLLCNAVEHGEGGPIDVDLQREGMSAAVSVRDHGVGLSDGEARFVFNRFWRADPARARSTGGTGLGLAIALEDTRLHGGSLSASGHPGAGSRFVLRLPLRPPAAGPAQPPVGAPAPAARRP